AVTEPTPLGAYDLEVMLKLAKKMGIATEIVLNKSDVGNRKEIEKISKKFKSEISIEIPYSEELVRAYSGGNLKKMVNII
ncbi:unnamed protein product, partial [marine sediment metagenome]